MTKVKGKITYIIDSAGNRNQLLPETSADKVIVDAISGLTATDAQSAIAELYNLAKNGGVTGVKGNAESTYRTGNVNITKANIGLDKVDNTADSTKTVAKAVSDGNGNNIVNTYATKTALNAVSEKANSSYSYADSAYKLAAGRARSVAFDTVAAMTSALKSANNTEYKVGDNLFIKEVGVPDYWISAVLSTNAGTYGYYEISILETQKVDLTPYQTKTDNTLNTTNKTVAGAINELNSNLDWSSYSGDAGGVGEALNVIEGTLQGLPDRIIALENDNTTNKSQITDLSNNFNKIISGDAKAGYALKADKLATARTIALSGDVTGNTLFDGLANKTITTTLKNSGVTAGSYSAVTVNAKGIVTSGGNAIEIDSGTHTPSENLMVGGIFLELDA